MKSEKELAKLQVAIRNTRKNKRISQEELAERLDVSPTHIKHIESGHRKPSVELLFEIAKVLNLSLDSIIHPQNTIPCNPVRQHIDWLLDDIDEATLQFILILVEALHAKNITD